MHSRIAHNALFADLFLAGFKLGLDEADDLSVLPQQLPHGGQNDPERDERHVDDRQIQRLAEIVRRDIADVRPLHHDHARIFPNFPRKLPVSHVDGKYLLCPLLEQAVGKAAGGRAGVAANESRHIHAEIAQRLFELQAAAADIRAGAAAHLNGRFRVKFLPGFIRLLSRHEYRAAHNDRLRLGAGLRKSALGQQHIQPFFILHATFPP